VRKSRYSDEQIVAILAESDSGVKTLELCRRYGINKNTLYKWKGKYAGMQTSDVRRPFALVIPLDSGSPRIMGS
jgi:putative transposase